MAEDHLFSLGVSSESIFFPSISHFEAYSSACFHLRSLRSICAQQCCTDTIADLWVRASKSSLLHTLCKKMQLKMFMRKHNIKSLFKGQVNVPNDFLVAFILCPGQEF